MTIMPNSSFCIEGVKVNIHFLQDINEEYDTIHNSVLESIANGFENRMIKNHSNDKNLKTNDK